MLCQLPGKDLSVSYKQCKEPVTQMTKKLRNEAGGEATQGSVTSSHFHPWSGKDKGRGSVIGAQKSKFILETKMVGEELFFWYWSRGGNTAAARGAASGRTRQ